MNNKRWLAVFLISFILAVSFYYLSIQVAAESKAEYDFSASPQFESTPYFLPFISNSALITATSTATPTPTPTSTSTVTSTATQTATSTIPALPTPGVTPTFTATPTSTATASCDFGPYTLPYRLEFENYACGGEGIAYHDADPTNNGGEYRLDEGVDLAVAISSTWGNSYFVGWTEDDEWLNYEVYVDYTGTYYFTFLVSSLYDSGRFHLEIDGENVTGTLQVPNTGGEQNWRSVMMMPTGTYLTAGNHIFKLVIESGGGNYNFLNIITGTRISSAP